MLKLRRLELRLAASRFTVIIGTFADEVSLSTQPSSCDESESPYRWIRKKEHCQGESEEKVRVQAQRQ